MRAAALTEPTAIALHTVNLSGAEPGDRVLITGARPGRPAHDGGAPRPWHRRHHGLRARTAAPAARAARLGAAHVVAPEALPRAPMGRPVAEPYTLAFECSGHAAAAEAALDQLDYAGTLVFVGTGHELPRVNHNRAIVLELTIIGAYNYDADGFAGALALLASGTLPLDRLIEAGRRAPRRVAADDGPARGRRARRAR